MNEPKPIPEPRKIGKNEKMFVANGVKYYVTDAVSVARFKEYEKLSILLTYGVDYKSIFNTLKKVYTKLNDRQFADSSVMVHNLMAGIAEVEDDKRLNPALMLCTLFINREDENTAIYDKALCMEKIQDWEKEGMDILSFFTMALNAIHGFRETYIEFIQNQAEVLIAKEQKESQTA